jgi:nitrite reductase (NADH) small subunit/3-phenylpropionate/trans-cinnamate dioxygenase ferredoxin subunit
MSEFITVAKVGSIEDGTGQAFAVGGKMVAVFNCGGKYYAINDFCPHMGASLASGYLEGETVTCPWHAWRFRVTDGAWMDNPKVHTACYELQIVGDEIQVRVPPAQPKPEEPAHSAN